VLGAGISAISKPSNQDKFSRLGRASPAICWDIPRRKATDEAYVGGLCSEYKCVKGAAACLVVSDSKVFRYDAELNSPPHR